MHDYIAINASTANWLLSQASRKSSIGQFLTGLSELKGTQAGVVSLGALRISSPKNLSVIAIWNVDLLSGRGYEKWGFCKLTGEDSLLAEPQISEEVFERFLQVVDLRLSGLKLEDRMIHRHVEDDMHTCLSGRGAARQFALGFSDKPVEIEGSKVANVFAVGPVVVPLGTVPASLKAERKKAGLFVSQLAEMLSALHTRPALDAPTLVSLRSVFQPETQMVLEYQPGLPSFPVLPERTPANEPLTFEEWTAPDSNLSKEQRAILESDLILKSPVRIVGPAGSGKTLLMQLLTIRRLRTCEAQGTPCRIAYVVHNAAMMQTVKERFLELGCEIFAVTEQRPQILEVVTLSEYSRKALEPEAVPVIDGDAYETKKFQIELVTSCLLSKLQSANVQQDLHPLLFQVLRSADTIPLFSELLVTEFGVAIKGHDLAYNKQGYVLAETSLSRLHSVLKPDERSIVFDIFSDYHRQLTDDLRALDADDLAITVLGKVSTPLWRLKRRTAGYDFIFVDEAQLFNENERRIFPLLTKDKSGHVPIALALDDAQAIHASYGAGLGALGFGDLSNTSLNRVFRSTPAILRLAFHIIQKSTDLFGPDFPDFTKTTTSLIADDHHSAKPPVLLTGGQAKSPGNFVLKIVNGLRSANLRQIAVVVFSDRYWNEVRSALCIPRLPFQELTTRGDKIDARKPTVVVTKPEFVGGQEFDAVVCVGLEEGVAPPSVGGNHTLAASFEQRILRELYVTITRARYRLVVANTINSNPSPLLRDSLGVYLQEGIASEWLK
jgi:hypothetical protein